MLDLLGGLSAYLVFFAVIALYYALVTLGLNLQWGFTGLFNVGVAGFVLVGAYTTGILTTPDDPGRIGGFGLPVPVGMLGAMLMAGFFALLVGIPALRLRHDYLAITTFGIAVTLQLLALNLQVLTGGPFGMNFIPRPFQDTLGSGQAWNILYLLFVAILVLLVWRGFAALTDSPWGRVLRAIREDETAASALGKHAFRFRLEAFVIGAMVMGLAGAVYAHFIGFVAPEDFLPILTFQVWAMLVVGGSGSHKGAITGAVLVWAIWTGSGALLDQLVPPESKAQAAALQVAAIGMALCIVLLFRPQGLLGARTRGSV
ncbi:MAG TPA: branched-chain amino acid ABC transporter permease [Geminicoccus sp.]|jgi:branched-chain amino acid transport system permease protein|uniref:branched-chain amino acid ABC transporter permease n=1 Tax=Geminicoccus sp. TaxID=2024832 RepID=UPI002E2F6590|nr:branched-chain amino acid ABC transporter permease [Geminicoccus sp.]HEX2529540.1 branched-chain amino acid ABC transporter permease [Geminicoccus sp.]